MEAADEAKCWMQTHFQWPGGGEGQAASAPFWAVVRGWDLSMADLPRTRMGSRGWLTKVTDQPAVPG